MKKKLKSQNDLGKKYDDYFEIVSVIVSVDKKSWDIHIKLKDLIGLKQIKEIENEFSKKFNIPHVKLIKEEYTQPRQIQKLINNSWPSIIKEAIKDNPMLAGFLTDSILEYKDNNLIIILNSKESLEFLKEKNFDTILKNILLEYLSLNIRISLKSKTIQEDKEEFVNGISKEELEIVHKALKDSKNNSVAGKALNTLIHGKAIKNKNVSEINTISEESGRVVVEGTVFDIESRLLNNGKTLLGFCITDYTSSINCKMFIGESDSEKRITSAIIEGQYLRINGDIQLDRYTKETVLYPNSIEKLNIDIRQDSAKEKRVELHTHTNMSAMDAITGPSELVKRASYWGHEAISITDHGVVQAFPEAYKASKEFGVKVIYGLEGYLVNDTIPVVYNSRDYSFDDEFVVFDIETTGFSNTKDSIIEIGAVIIKDKKIVKEYSSLINPRVAIPQNIIKLTGISNEMVKNERVIDLVLPEFLEFVGRRPLIAHNALFDWGFIKTKAGSLGLLIDNTLIDTLQLSRKLLDLKKYRLDTVCDYFAININNHHRAKDDAKATARLFIEMMELLKEKDINNISEIDDQLKGIINYKAVATHHITILVQNSIGLKNLYKLVSISHIDYFYKKPRILKSVLEKYKDGLIIGSACEAGEVFQSVYRNIDNEAILDIVKLYDYFEIQPLANNEFMLRNGMIDKKGLIDINKRIVSLGASLNKLVVATGDVHFIDPKDEQFRRILMAGQGYSDADYQPPLYYRTTEEMLMEFEYLGEELAKKVVVTNTKAISNMVDNVIPIPEDTFTPKIMGAEGKVKEMTLKKAHDIYGEVLPEIVEKRLYKELDSIINNGYAVMYLIAHKLVAKSLEDGYLVGSRGSVGSSFVATMCGITEVNPLPPHYICPSCKYSSFEIDDNIYSGADLAEKTCEKCGAQLGKDGHDIPFEIFLGFKGEKEPDIDLNFASEYQMEAHKYTEEIFGEGYVFRAGTIGTIADKTAYGFIKKYYDERNEALNSAEIKRLIRGCLGVKRTTGQHPGGVMIVPSDKEIFDFTPIQRPADDSKSSVITTHFDYRSISGRLLKLDILGHDVPSIIKALEDMTGIPADSISLDNKETLSLFVSTKALNISLKEIGCKVGTLGIPEFGTKFVRQMLIDTKPTTFAELVRISGLSHGTDVWLNNAQDLIKNGTAKLKDVISTRDDIMLYLISKQLKPSIAFQIAEDVRKGKGLTDEQERYMESKGIPSWYIKSCKIIKYLFPKAHATAYVMMSFRIAYYKIFYPEAFYAAFFTTRVNDFDADLLTQDKNHLKRRLTELEKKGSNASAKDKNLITLMEVVYEMNLRDIKLLPVNLYKSDKNRFLVTEDGILSPLRTLQGLGNNAAMNIIRERNSGKFVSIEDLQQRTRISKTVIEIMEDLGCLNDLPKTNQISLF